MSEAEAAPMSVYEVYEAVEKCVEHYAEASLIVEPYRRLQRNQPSAKDMIEKAPEEAKKLQGRLELLHAATEEAGKLVQPLARDIHRASAGLVDWSESKASSVAEAVVRLCEKVCELEWTEGTLTEEGAKSQCVLLIREPMDRDLVTAKLNLEAARVVDLQERKGPDLARLSDTEKRVYAAVLLHGPITEKGINQILYGNPQKGDSRRHAAPMVRHGIFDQTSDGYVIREPGNIVRTNVS